VADSLAGMIRRAGRWAAREYWGAPPGGPVGQGATYVLTDSAKLASATSLARALAVLLPDTVPVFADNHESDGRLTVVLFGEPMFDSLGRVTFK